MAIAKMQKVSIVTEPSQKEDLLYALQTLQTVEVIDLVVKLADHDSGYVQHNLQGSDEYELVYNRIEDALKYLTQYKQKVPLKQSIAAKRPKLTMMELSQQVDDEQIIQLVEQVESLKKEREDIQDTRDKVSEQQDLVGKWRNLPLNPKDLQTLSHFTVRLGTLPNDDSRKYWQTILDSEDVSLDEIYTDENEIGVAVVTNSADLSEVDRLLVDNHFQPLDYNFDGQPKAIFTQLEEQRKGLIDQEKQVVDTLQQLQDKVLTLKIAAEEYFNRSQRQKATQMSYDNEQLVLINGWIEEEQFANLQEELSSQFDENLMAIISEEISEKEIEDNEVPIKLHNNSIFEPFEMVTEMYSLPNYREMDPTNWVAIFYIIFFGMMVGDLGYGLLLWISTLFALKVMDLKKGTRRFVKFGHIVSYSTMLVGLIYGSFFGTTLPFQLINPTEDAIILMGISIGIGYIHLLVALSLNVYLRFREKDYAAAYNDGIGWLLMLLGLGVGIGGFVSAISILTTIGITLAIVGAAGIIIVPIITDKNKVIGGVLGLYNLYGVSSYIGDFVSYTRLMALGISGGSIAMAFNIIFGILPIPVRFTAGIVLIVGLQLFNMFLSLLSAYVHSLRLIFVEFFGKFYEGGGKAFKPIRTLQNYVSLKDVQED